jgi:hypothetical protein
LGVAIGAQTQFDDAIVFTVPLAIVAVIASVVITPLLANNPRIGNFASGIFVIIAVAMSLALAGRSGIWLPVTSTSSVIEILSTTGNSKT